MEGYALPALIGALIAGAGTWLTLGRNTVTKREQEGFCAMMQAPIKVELVHLKEGQGRVEVKVDEALSVLHKMNGGK